MDNDIRQILKLLKAKKVFWRGHAFRRMLERDIRKKEILGALKNDDIIESYPDSLPYPAFLILGFTEGKPLHIVCALSDDFLWIITVYRPDNKRWTNDFKTRKR